MNGRAFVFLTCAAALAAGPGSKAGEGREERPTITVDGTGKIAASPDVAEITVGVVTQAPSAQDALAANNEAMAKLHQTLKERGVAVKDIQTTQIQVLPQYSAVRPPGAPSEFPPRIVGYRVENSVQITARQLAQFGALLDALVQAGANQVHGITFRVGQPEKLLDEARRRAMADAKRKAEALAGEADVVVGPPLKIQEGGGPPPPTPLFARAPMMAASVLVAPGEQELSITVHVVYQLREAKPSP